MPAEEFVRIDFGSDIKAELDNGVIRMTAGGTRDHSRVQANLMAFVRSTLRGSGCRPYGSDMAVRTHDYWVRYPDLMVTAVDLALSSLDVFIPYREIFGQD